MASALSSNSLGIAFSRTFMISVKTFAASLECRVASFSLFVFAETSGTEHASNSITVKTLVAVCRIENFMVTLLARLWNKRKRLFRGVLLDLVLRRYYTHCLLSGSSLRMRSVPPRGSGWVFGSATTDSRLRIGVIRRGESAIDTRQSRDPPATAWWY